MRRGQHRQLTPKMPMNKTSGMTPFRPKIPRDENPMTAGRIVNERIKKTVSRNTLVASPDVLGAADESRSRRRQIESLTRQVLGALTQPRSPLQMARVAQNFPHFPIKSITAIDIASTPVRMLGSIAGQKLSLCIDGKSAAPGFFESLQRGSSMVPRKNMQIGTPSRP
jgi:hypothetical protein